MKFEWKTLESNWSERRDECIITSRAKVIGGWAFKYLIWLTNSHKDEETSTTMIFIPDPEHKWGVDK